LNEPDIRCGLIVDGIHSHPLMVELAYRCKGAGGITLVTDAMAAMGMLPGRYEIGGQAVWVDATGARQAEGRLAGSILTMDQAVRNMIAFTDCKLVEAVQMASTVPARVLEMDDRLGHLQPGYPADLVLLDESAQVQATLIAGHLCYSRPESLQRLQTLISSND
jgi:N-acetylglucosamine-6-phosphate deacetylase